MRITSLLMFLIGGIFFQAQAQFTDKFPAAEPKKAEIHQFHDAGLAHYSYAIIAEAGIYLVDPGRDVRPYLALAEEKSSRIAGVINTHPHADFVSSHLELHETLGVPIYVSTLVGAAYPHQAFDEGDILDLGNGVTLRAMHTPGHSPDGISIVLEEDQQPIAVFTGDTLFIGDVGRPDLRENAGNMTADRVELAKMMYASTREKLMPLPDATLVYPAHGAGSFCGKAIGTDNVSTIGKEKATNYALQNMTEAEFVALLLEDQPFIPLYFPYNVEVNKRGAATLTADLARVPRLAPDFLTEQTALPLIDARNQALFKASHLPGALNIMQGAKFETWLGALLPPGQSFYLVSDSEENLDALIAQTAKIGYDKYIVGAFVYGRTGDAQMQAFEQAAFEANPEAFTILDIRNPGEVAEGKLFEQALAIPLPELQERAGEIPTDKPVVVHCGTGYRSAIGSSIVHKTVPQAQVIDMGAAVKNYQK
ncbi:MAG: MBL fold metallo-hydrolase [Nitritalea sp.]